MGRTMTKFFRSGARVFVDGKSQAIVRQAFPKGSTSHLFAHYKVDLIGGDTNVAIAMDRVGVERATRPAYTKTTTFASDGFERTALVLGSPGAGSIDILDKNGKRVAQINLSFSDGGNEECFIADVIDVDDRFTERRMLAFSNAGRSVHPVPDKGKLVSVDFRKEK